MTVIEAKSTPLPPSNFRRAFVAYGEPVTTTWSLGAELVRVTTHNQGKLTTAIFPNAAKLFGQNHPKETAGALTTEYGGDLQLLREITELANHPLTVDPYAGYYNRRNYAEKLGFAFSDLWRKHLKYKPNAKDAVLAPVGEAGRFLVSQLDLKNTHHEPIKVFRAKQGRDLHVEVEMPEGYETFAGKHILLVFAVEASGASPTSIIAGLNNAGIHPDSVDTINLVAGPAGLRHKVNQIRHRLHIPGNDYCGQIAGVIDPNYRLVWAEQDEQIYNRPDLTGQQIFGPANLLCISDTIRYESSKAALDQKRLAMSIKKQISPFTEYPKDKRIIFNDITTPV